MNRGYLHTVVWVVLLSLLAMIALYFLPTLTIGDHQLRRVDILADLRPAINDDEQEATTVTEMPQTEKTRIDTCPQGITPIIDFSPLNGGQGMDPLYEALANLKSLGRPVRIAVLGDSYIEGDIVTAKLRQLMQQRYGGCGVGLIPITSDSPGFRHTVAHSFKGWTSHHANDNGGYSSTYANLTGHYFFPDSNANASVTLTGTTKYLSLLDSCEVASIYYSASGYGSISVRTNGTSSYHKSIVPCPITAFSVEGKIGKATWSVNANSNDVTCFGVAMDCTQGVVVDNFGLRSASGTHLGAVSEKMWQEMDHARHYDLIILAYGLNVASKNRTDYSGYTEKMTKIINAMKNALPGTGFLVVSIADRDQRTTDGFKTMRGIKSLVNAQRNLAQNCQVAFWNLYDAMGGEGSVARMVDKKEANLDYTHINHKGGMRIGRLLFDAIEWGNKCYTDYNQQ